MFVRGHTTEFKLTDGLKQAIETAQVEYKELVKALEISYLLYPRLQGNKNKDVMMQAAFQVSPPLLHLSLHVYSRKQNTTVQE